MADTFAVGDIVQLKAGGPYMTVSTNKGNLFWCKWFDGQNKLQTAEFAPAELKKPAPPKGASITAL